MPGETVAMCSIFLFLFQVMKLIEAAEKTEQRRKEEKLLHYAREGKAEEVTKLVRLSICNSM